MFVQWLLSRMLEMFRRARRGPRGDRALIRAITRHLNSNFHVEPAVFHEIISARVHIDVYAVPPGEDRPYYTLVTSGMSQRPMPVPPEAPHAARYVELVMMLPPDWHMEHRAFEDERWYWPLRHLKMLARAPHEWATWFGPGHTMQFDADLKPFAANTSFCAYLLAPEPFGEGFSPLRVDAKREVTFLMAVPIYAEELEFARAHGASALARRFEENDIDLVVDPNRVNVCKGD